MLLFTFWYESVLRRVEVVAHVHISSDSFICREKVYFNGRRENEVSLLLLHLIFMHIFCSIYSESDMMDEGKIMFENDS